MYIVPQLQNNLFILFYTNVLYFLCVYAKRRKCRGGRIPVVSHKFRKHKREMTSKAHNKRGETLFCLPSGLTKHRSFFWRRLTFIFVTFSLLCQLSELHIPPPFCLSLSVCFTFLLPADPKALMTYAFTHWGNFSSSGPPPSPPSTPFEAQIPILGLKSQP